MSATQLLVLFIVSLIANLLSALAGGGAGLLQLPALLILGLSFSTALATHKVASVALGVGASLRHLRGGGLDWKFALYILACGLPGVWLGAKLILRVPEQLAELSLGVLTLMLGLYSAMRPALGHEFREAHRDGRGMAAGGVVLAFIGMLNGSLTSGTGLFVTLWLIKWFGLDFTRATIYTLILVGLFWNGMGAFFLGMQAPIAWAWLPPLILGSLAGGYAGAHWALLKGNGFIKRSFEILTVLVGTHLIYKSLA
ncbi:hypothetical protein EV700_1375 [Fluviicoccus keumensis]|uniref:Probable membrane transporter protein n=1 Tax=Fluviicoccus keumensis TaxID=1435465 RepID=A0A4Q7Z926_9GAMM|nr:sulfite exporter TauE/SafE family protein [Fluviicoccus keumensis]RZU46988.1 hypothetical protein EV700_1375 [Fluviicoccus keumensis]